MTRVVGCMACTECMNCLCLGFIEGYVSRIPLRCHLTIVL